MAQTPEFQFWANEQSVYKSVDAYCSNENKMDFKIIFLSLTIVAESNFEHQRSENSRNFDQFYENLERFGENFELFVECTKILSEKMDRQNAANICTDVHQKSTTAVRQKYFTSSHK